LRQRYEFGVNIDFRFNARKASQVLGFAVVDENPRSGAVAVWLTSYMGSGHAAHTNAVIFERAELDVSKVAGLVSDRYLVLSDRTVTDVETLTGLPGQAVDVAELGRETIEVQQDLEAQIRAQKKSTAALRWPTPPAALVEWADQALPSAIALQTANHVAAIWSAWLRTDAERVTRIKNLTPKDPAIRQVPPKFRATYAPMSKPVPVGAP
jgi:hypothetical protein